MHVVATAGHVDHGKSTLVLALTGMDPDRFAEEKARGLTIDLGFAWTSLPSGRELAFVDVPGHVRFIKNMLAGVGAVDASLFVVAATEGWKPQSEEHLRILEVLGVEHGLVALTKVGLVDDEWLELAHLELADHLKGTFLENADVVDVDAPAGTGLVELQEALDRMLAVTPTAPDRGRPRLWVDRSFAAKGSGTVVTGTLAGGSLAVDDELVVVGGSSPSVAVSGRRARVRSLQSHKSSLSVASPGRRLAVNLAGVHHDEVERGHALVRPDQWAPTRRLDCSLTVLSALDHEVSRRGAYQAYLGSGEYPVRMRVLGAEALAPGSVGLVRLHLPVALPLLPGDRYVLRESGRSETVGGGEVLDVDPRLPAYRARPDRSVDRVVAERGWVEVDVLERLTGDRRPATVGGRWVVDPGVRAAVEARLAEAVAAAGPLGLDVAGLDERERALLAGLEGVVVDAGRAKPAGASGGAGAPGDGLADHPYLAALAASPFSPPPPEGVDRAELRELARRGLAVEREGVWFSPAALEEAGRVVARLLVTSPEGLTVAQVRDALGTSRKYILPVLAHLDATGVTRRRGDLRIGGPRLPAVP
ncbi:MAG TPA: selenocysteine-specific translation elongation factor [Acidimicrobiales bacterium]|nr:selenocysteine-specific translation elongation factor [Acidimicrobiales bacterium]